MAAGDSGIADCIAAIGSNDDVSTAVGEGINLNPTGEGNNGDGSGL